MAQTFPWPVTDDELALNRALENVVAAYGDPRDLLKPSADDVLQVVAMGKRPHRS